MGLEITRLEVLCLKVHEIMNESIRLDVVFMLLLRDTQNSIIITAYDDSLTCVSSSFIYKHSDISAKNAQYYCKRCARHI